MRTYWQKLIALMALVLFACQNEVQFSDTPSDIKASVHDEKAVVMNRAISGASGRDQIFQSMAPVLYATQLPQARVVIKTGELEIRVGSYDRACIQLQKLVTRWDGYVTQSSTHTPYAGVKQGTWMLRVPAERYDTAMAAIKGLAEETEREHTEGEDVTEEFYDLEARLRNKRLEEQQVRDILRRAGSISDVLEVQRELMRIREEIERAEGRQKFLQDRVRLSTINVHLHEAYPVPVSASGGFWATIADGFSGGVRGFANVLSTTITFLIAGIPVFIVFALIMMMTVKGIRRMRMQRSHKAE